MKDLPPSALYVQVIGFACTLVCCAILSFLETTITALRIFKLKELASSIKGYRTLFTVLEEQPNKVLFTILIANNLANATCTALISSVMQDLFARMHFSEGLGLTVGVAISTVAIILFGEMIPKNIARLYGDRLLRYTLGIANLVYRVFQPVVTVLTSFSDLILRKLMKNSSIEDGTSEQEIRFLISYIGEKGLIDPEKTSMLQSIFKLSQTPIKEIVVPENKMVTIAANATIQDAISLFSKHQFSRLPVYEDNKEDIIGIIYQKDIFFNAPDITKPIKEFIRPIMFVPERVKINKLLRDLKEKKMHMAIVLNEFGGVEGLVTLEDVLEEIVGPIVDEHEAIIEKINYVTEGHWLVDASAQLDDLGQILHIDFEAEDALTLGGFLIEQLQHLPVRGEELRYKGFVFQIQKADNKKVLQVLIFRDTITT